MTKSTKFGFNYLAQHQVSKDILINENFDKIDSLVWSTFKDIDTISPPKSAENGDAYIIPSNGTNKWSGRANQIALYRNKTTGWEYYPPKEGYCFYISKKNSYYSFNGTSWFAITKGIPVPVTGKNTPSVISPLGNGHGSVAKSTIINPPNNNTGSTILDNMEMIGIKDKANQNDRLVVNSNSALFKSSKEVSLKVSRGSINEESSITFLTGQTTNGKIGLLNDNYLHISTSQDGKNFHDGLLIKPDSGQVIIQNGSYIKGGIQFENHDQTLKDYDFGSWKPTIGSTEGNGVTNIYKNQTGSYMQIGKMVFINLFIECDSLSGTGNIVIEGLPKPVDTSILFFGNAIMQNVVKLPDGSFPNAIGIIDNTSRLFLLYTDKTGSSNMWPANIGNNFSIKASMMYMTNT